MRDAHKARALPNKKLPRGIERQDELLELIEKRFHQEDLIRDALRKKDEANAETASADERTSYAEESTAPADADERTPVSEAHTADEATAPADADEATAPAEDSATADEATDSVTIRWHGQNETICAPRTWLTVFDTVRKAGDAVTREVADRRFHGESYWKTCDALYLSTGTYYHHVRAILHYAFACAVYHRLIDPRPKRSFPKAM